MSELSIMTRLSWVALHGMAHSFIMQKGKMLSEEVLRIAEKRREAKGKGEKERYAHLNAEFQRIVRRDKKAFLSEQCKEIEENKRMGKTRDIFTKIKDTKVTKMSTQRTEMVWA